MLSDKEFDECCKYILAYMAIKKAMSEIESIISDTDELWEILDECALELKRRTFILTQGRQESNVLYKFEY